ncbi:DUF1932 domain-containing protein [Streptomyces bacillaris]|uniref:DUF1932 domain-containing protein n=1 Tax=Streptomyces bacillaris TaxID=68179 RepID=UPI0035DE3B55
MAPEVRGEDTWHRPTEAGATPCDSLAEALSRSAVVLSVCPPQAAEDVAAAVAAHGFAGVYADVNAISPQRVRRIADEIRPGSASALRMAFAGYQKAARTLAGVAHALADAHGVDDRLTAEAEVMISAILSDPDYLLSVAARAWRWAPETEEVADTLRAADLPTDMAEATARVLAYWEQDKDQYDLPVAHALSRLRTEGNS